MKTREQTKKENGNKGTQNMLANKGTSPFRRKNKGVKMARHIVDEKMFII